MEPNPLRIPDQEYIELRRHLLERLTPDQKAFFFLLENLLKLETREDPEGASHEITFDYGVKPAKMIRDLLAGHTDSPRGSIPGASETSSPLAFTWRTNEPHNGQYLDMRVDVQDVLTLHANIGDLSLVEGHIAGLINPIPFPSVASDSFGFHMRNYAAEIYSDLELVEQ